MSDYSATKCVVGYIQESWDFCQIVSAKQLDWGNIGSQHINQDDFSKFIYFIFYSSTV